jgi:AmiR/NasT family two-component response regulator
LERVKKGLKSRQNPKKIKALLADWKKLTLDEAYQKIMMAETNR